MHRDDLSLSWSRYLSSYALDHWRLLLGALTGLGLAIVTLWLAGMVSGYAVHGSDLGYAFGLGVGTLMLGLLWDSLIRRESWETIHRLSAAPNTERLAFTTPDDAPTADARACFHALRALETTWRDHQARTEEKVLFYIALTTRLVHHMKTPLQALWLLMQLADQAADDGAIGQRWRELSRHCWAELRRLDSLVRQALQTVRLEDLLRDFRPQRVPLLSLVRTIIAEYHHDWTIRMMTPRIEVEGNAADYVAFTDEPWLRLLIEQIVKNALQYGRSTLTITFRHDVSTMTLEFRDDGEGMTAEDQARAFEPFYTGQAGRKAATATGLGLYLAHQIAQRLGYQLTLASEPGQGTTVTLRIPRATFLAPAQCQVEQNRK
jgi:signal transduction histidine kinase